MNTTGPDGKGGKYISRRFPLYLYSFCQIYDSISTEDKDGIYTLIFMPKFFHEFIVDLEN